jgi:hypothetical protein
MLAAVDREPLVLTCRCIQLLAHIASSVRADPGRADSAHDTNGPDPWGAHEVSVSLAWPPSPACTTLGLDATFYPADGSVQTFVNPMGNTGEDKKIQLVYVALALGTLFFVAERWPSPAASPLQLERPRRLWAAFDGLCCVISLRTYATTSCRLLRRSASRHSTSNGEGIYWCDRGAQ